MNKIKKLTSRQINSFQKIIRKHYRAHGRKLPWRKTHDPYKILVSEIMLQQTQVSRVLPKYAPFLKRFPNTHALARAPFSEVLSVWSGLGYNRRAQYLHQTAQEIVSKHKGVFPQTTTELQTLRGVGQSTAGALFAFAFNKPTVFIETNIRSVFIYFFFKNKKSVLDAEIAPLIEKTLDRHNSREWYYALMDYGVFLKSHYKNPNRKSAHYIKQSSFTGSRREVRGEIIKLLIAHGSLSKSGMQKHIKSNAAFIKNALAQLTTEGFVDVENNRLRLREI